MPRTRGSSAQVWGSYPRPQGVLPGSQDSGAPGTWGAHLGGLLQMVSKLEGMLLWIPGVWAQAWVSSPPRKQLPLRCAHGCSR